MLQQLDNLFKQIGQRIEENKINRYLFRSLWKAIDSLFWQPAEITRGAPFIRAKLDLKDFMGAVIFILLFTSVLPAIYFFGWQTVLSRLTVSFICGVFITDLSWAVLTREEKITEGAFVTCLFIPLIFPPLAPLWIIGLASILAILIRNCFGGVGRNIWNPALLGRLLIFLSFAASLSLGWKESFWGIPDWETLRYGLDAVSAATPLTLFKNSGESTPFFALLLGRTTGSLGETCRIALFAGGILLCWMGIANWRIPLSYLTSVFIFSSLLNLWGIERAAPPGLQLFGGGLILGAFFMATDPVTAPASHGGKFFFGTGCGLLTVYFRTFSPFPEGVMFAILLMNTLKSLIDWIIKQGYLRRRKSNYLDSMAR